MNFTRKLIGLGAAITFSVLAVSLWTEIVWAQEQIAIYRVLPAQVTREAVLKLAREAFGMSSPQVTEDSARFVLEQEQKRLTVWKISGAISFSDNSKLWNPNYRASLPSRGDAIQLAVDFLRKQQLLPPEGDPNQTKLAPNAVARGLKNQEGTDYVTNHWLVKLPLVSFRSAVGTPIIGADLGLRMGTSGEVLALTVPFLQLEVAQTLPQLESGQAFELLEWQLQARREDLKVSGEPQLVYLYPQEDARFVFPAYLLTTLQEHSHGGYLLPATRFTPLARITTPRDGATFPKGASIELRAEVRAGFGTPPYQFRWISSLDGLLGSAATLRKTLSEGPHTITLIVTDRNGIEASHTLRITIGSPQAIAAKQRALIQAGPEPKSERPWIWTRGLPSLLLFLAGLFLGLRSRSHQGRWTSFLMLTVGGLLLVSSISQAQGDGQALQDITYTWKLEGGDVKMDVKVMNSDDGLTLQNVEVPGGCQALQGQRCFVLRELSVPFVEVETGGSTYRFELAKDKATKFSATAYKVACSETPKIAHGVKLEANYEGLKAQGTNITLDITESFRFYSKSSCRAPSPDFMPQLSYKINNVPKGAKAILRIPYYFDFDLDGTATDKKEGDDDVAAMVREPIWEFYDVAGIVAPRGIILNCKSGDVAPILKGERSIIDCGHPDRDQPQTDPSQPQPPRKAPKEFSNRDFDNYHQADNFLVVPLCSGHTGGRWTLCAHLHYYLPQIQQFAKPIELHVDYYAVQYKENEKELEKVADLKNKVLNGEDLKDIVLWLVLEMTHIEGQTVMTKTLFLDTPFFPAYWGGFSCGAPLFRLGLPSC
jgi:hypothetical protein